MVTKQTLEEVFERRFIDAAENWKAACPFHDEKTPSFYVSKENYLANCFGCGRGGRLETLGAEYQETTIQEARSRLGIDVSDIVGRNKAFVKRQAPQLFPESWLAPFRKEVHKYVLERQFSLETLRQAESLYDQNLKRQVFPHRNRDGRLLGVAGRACQGQDPKWLFYWSYNKGQALYMPALWQAGGSQLQSQTASSIKNTNAPTTPTRGFLQRLVIVEGVFDALWFIQNGYLNVAATLGTKVTMQQVREIRSLTDHVYLAMDNDTSGAECTEWLYSRLKRTTNVSFCTYPPGFKDPVGMSKDELDMMVHQAKNSLQRKLDV